MEDGNNPSNSNAGGNKAAMAQQLLLQQHQHQLRLLQQYQQQQHQHQHQQQQSQARQQQQQAMSRFPSNIDAHLRAPGLRSFQFHQPQQQQQIPQAQAAAPQPPHQQQQRPVRPVGSSIEMEMTHQDVLKVCNPDFKRPFASVEDAVLRLLPYHVVSDFEAEEDDKILDSDTTGQLPSRLQQWDHNILGKISEFTTTFEKQVLAFNIMSRKRAYGEFRSEERLMIEQALLQEEKQALLELRAEMESREKAGREAAEAKMRMAMAEQARAEAQACAEMMVRAPMRGSAMGSHADEGPGQDAPGQEQGRNAEEMIHGWGNAQGEEEDPSEDFLNDENEDGNGESQDDWRQGGKLDLNSR